MPKTDYEQLKGILEEFDDKTVLKVLRERNFKTEDLYQPIRKTVKDFPKVRKGAKSKVGDRNHVSREAYVAAKPIERVIDQPDFMPVHFLECGWNRQKPVARIHVSGYWWGSGFLVSRSLIMTNNHVIENEVQGRLATAEFNYQVDHEGSMLTTDTWDGDPDDFFHTNAALDYTVMRLKGRRLFSLTPYLPPQLATPIPRLTIPGYTPIPRPPLPGPDPLMPTTVEGLTDLIARVFGTATLRDWGKIIIPTQHAGDTWGYIPLKDTILTEGTRVNIIQHPQVRPKEVCLHDNNLEMIYDNVLHYRTDTDLGSSGSPVFDNSWDIIALHHAAGHRDPPVTGPWIDNEGMRIDMIIDDLQSSLRGTADEGVLTELGIP